jgi:hypothetical protein
MQGIEMGVVAERLRGDGWSLVCMEIGAAICPDYVDEVCKLGEWARDSESPARVHIHVHVLAEIMNMNTSDALLLAVLKGGVGPAPSLPRW